MKNKKTTITVGIPAFNEEANIGSLIRDILSQDIDGFKLEKIIVSSDGSVDKTNEIVKSFKSNKILLITNKKRLGLAENQNNILKRVNSDYLILLNADIQLADKKFLQNVVEETIKKNTDLGGVVAKPKKANGFIGAAIRQGWLIRNKAFYSYNKGRNWFNCIGVARIFSKKLYKNFRFKMAVGEDLYSYLFVADNSYKFDHITSSHILFRIPENWADHKKQALRFQQAMFIMKKNFNKETTKNHLKTPRFNMLVSFMTGIINKPLESVAYLFLLLYSRVLNVFAGSQYSTDFWPMAQSTRKV